MLLALLSGFALSQAFRTTTALMAQGLTAEFGLSAQSLGAFAGLFGLSFGVAQLLMGVGLDLYGLRRTVLAAFPLAIAGAAFSLGLSLYQPWADAKGKVPLEPVMLAIWIALGGVAWFVGTRARTAFSQVERRRIIVGAGE